MCECHYSQLLDPLLFPARLPVPLVEGTVGDREEPSGLLWPSLDLVNSIASSPSLTSNGSPAWGKSDAKTHSTNLMCHLPASAHLPFRYMHENELAPTLDWQRFWFYPSQHTRLNKSDGSRTCSRPLVLQTCREESSSPRVQIP